MRTANMKNSDAWPRALAEATMMTMYCGISQRMWMELGSVRTKLCVRSIAVSGFF